MSPNALKGHCGDPASAFRGERPQPRGPGEPTLPTSLAVQIAMEVVTLPELHGRLDGQRPFSWLSPLLEATPFTALRPLTACRPFKLARASGTTRPARAGAASAARTSPTAASFMATVLLEFS